MQYAKAKITVTVLGALVLSQFGNANAQHKVKEIAFHLYTDSLKKGVYNYINVDALLDNDHWRPMDTSHIAFVSSVGQWSGNNLMLDTAFAQDSVVVKAYLKSNPAMLVEKTIYIKKNKDPETLPTMQDVMDARPRRKKG
ncbi:MAG: hypothetical protein QM610_08670 [Chitinophagaceae bacterium]